jgi:hypothetical protein
MDDIDLANVARTTTLTLLTDWPLSKPNRDLSGDQKAATIGGVRRHVMSSANRKAVWRRVMVPGSLLWLATKDPMLAGTYSMSARTKHVAYKLIAGPMVGEVDERLDDHWRMPDRDVMAVRAKLEELGLREQTRSGANLPRWVLLSLRSFKRRRNRLSTGTRAETPRRGMARKKELAIWRCRKPKQMRCPHATRRLPRMAKGK